MTTLPPLSLLAQSSARQFSEVPREFVPFTEWWRAQPREEG